MTQVNLNDPMDQFVNALNENNVRVMLDEKSGLPYGYVQLGDKRYAFKKVPTSWDAETKRQNFSWVNLGEASERAESPKMDPAIVQAMKEVFGVK